MSIQNNFFNFNFLRYFRWHPEVAIRYLPIVNKIKKQKSKVKNILEVGSGWLGIAPYLGESVVGVDENFRDKKYHLLNQVTGNVLEIPFGDRSFDFVICVDVLEHINSERRQKALEELLRVAKSGIFLGVPCGQKSIQQDEKLAELYKKIFGSQFLFLQDHLKFGLPEVSIINQGLKLAGKKFHQKIIIETEDNEGLNLREFLMKGWMTKNILKDFIFRKLFLLLIPLFKFFDRPPYYRKLFFVTIES